jgi:hypothetical protein
VDLNYPRKVVVKMKEREKEKEKEAVNRYLRRGTPHG